MHLFRKGFAILLVHGLGFGRKGTSEHRGRARCSLPTLYAKPKAVKIVKPKTAKVAEPQAEKKKRVPKPKEIIYEGIEPLSNILYPTKADKLKYANAVAALMEKNKADQAKATATPKE